MEAMESILCSFITGAGPEFSMTTVDKLTTIARILKVESLHTLYSAYEDPRVQCNVAAKFYGKGGNEIVKKNRRGEKRETLAASNLGSIFSNLLWYILG